MSKGSGSCSSLFLPATSFTSMQWIFWCKIQLIINPYFISSFKILSAPKRCAWIFCLLVTSNLHKYAYIWQACTESNWKLGKLGLSYIQYTVFNKGLHSIYIIMHKTQKHGIVKPLRFIFSWSIYIGRVKLSSQMSINLIYLRRHWKESLD